MIQRQRAGQHKHTEVSNIQEEQSRVRACARASRCDFCFAGARASCSVPHTSLHYRQSLEEAGELGEGLIVKDLFGRHERLHTGAVEGLPWDGWLRSDSCNEEIR